jgi:hypothetical protein
VFATVGAIADAIRWAERIMEEIDRQSHGEAHAAADEPIARAVPDFVQPPRSNS